MDTESNEPEKSISRRGLFSETGKGIARFLIDIVDLSEDIKAELPEEPEGVYPVLQYLRPPGAVAEKEFLDKCTRCGDCIDVCPAKAIILAPAGVNLAEGTPVIEPLAMPCVVCSTLPCIPVCEPGVLKMLDLAAIRMGLAEVNTSTCLAHQGTACNICLDYCPFPDVAITFQQGLPIIHEEACTGCGVCAHYCKKMASSAIRMLPV